jgi:two-component system cell cycle sensor histidine kinase/response regulator CckA
MSPDILPFRLPIAILICNFIIAPWARPLFPLMSLDQEQKTRQSSLNRAVLDSITSNIAVLESDGRVITLNRAWRDFKNSDELPEGSHFRAQVGSNYPELCAGNSEEFGEKASEIANSIREILGGSRRRYFLEYCTTISGRSAWFYMLVTPLQTQEGGAVVSHTEITGRKEAEDKLRKNEAQLQFVADTVPTIIAYLDTDRKFVFVNEACRKWFRRSTGEIIGRHIMDVAGPAAYEKLCPEIDTVLSGEAITRKRSAYLDETKYIYANYMPDRDNDGKVQGFFLFIVDLTDTKQAEDQLRKSEEQLRQAQKLESIGRLAGGIAHDFNNMLTAINGYCELTLLRLPADSPLRRNIEEIRKAGERSAALTDQLLAFSRRQILEVKTLDVNKIVEDSIVMIKRVIGEDITIDVRLDDSLWNIRGDQSQLTQVLLNLVVNSRDAMPSGGVISIETTNISLDEQFTNRRPGSKPGEYVKLSVADTGIGMDEETQRHIFEPFFTTKETGKGTGLGLSMVYGIVKQLEGYVWVTSLPNGGTTFDIYFPRETVRKSDVRQELSPVLGNTGSGLILLVEDEDIVRDLSKEILETCGYDVIPVSNGKAATEIFEREGLRIDLLMTDVVMPEMGGQELSERLRALKPDLKILFTSGYIEDPLPGISDTGDKRNFIQKPFTFEQLAQKIRTILTDAQK